MGWGEETGNCGQIICKEATGIVGKLCMIWDLGVEGQYGVLEGTDDKRSRGLWQNYIWR